MAVLGKRKAPESSASEVDANELLRRHFEARFQPLEEKASPQTQNDEVGEDSEEDEEWGGLSNDDEDEENEDDEDVDVSEDESSDEDGMVYHLCSAEYLVLTAVKIPQQLK